MMVSTSIYCSAGRRVRVSLSAPAPIPPQLPPMDVLLTANRFMTNRRLDGITHIVYVDAEGYSLLRTKEELIDVGKAVGGLGEILPK